MLLKYLKNHLGLNLTSKKNHKLTKSLDLPSNIYNFFKNPKIGAQSYLENVIVYRSVNLISQSAGHVPWIIYKNKNGERVIEKNHVAYKLLKKPNPFVSGADFFEEMIANILLFGNAYLLAPSLCDDLPNNANDEDNIESLSRGGGSNHSQSSSKLVGNNLPKISSNIPIEIYLLPPSSTSVIVKNDEKIGYCYQRNDGRKNFYRVDPVTNKSRVLHIKNYHPTDPYYGLSCLQAAALSIELHTAATKWNNALLKNGARPSGAIIVKDNDGYLTEEQFSRLQKQLHEKYAGLSNSGRPLLLEGGLEWREMSISPKDMDFIESKNTASREIAFNIGVPPQLIGIKGDNTYSNMSEARISFWEETLIPLLDKIGDNLSIWFSYLFGEEIIVDFDRENISALTEKRENLWDKVSNADFMTINEKRSYFGLEAIKDGDKFTKD